jgi:hypothetical protein
MRRITSDRNECRTVLANYACNEVLQGRTDALPNNHLPAFYFRLNIQKLLENFKAWWRWGRKLASIHRQQTGLGPIRLGNSKVPEDACSTGRDTAIWDLLFEYLKCAHAAGSCSVCWLIQRITRLRCGARLRFAGVIGGGYLNLHGPAAGQIPRFMQLLQGITASGGWLLAASAAMPENVNYAVKSSFLLSFLESVPGVEAKLKAPNTKDEKFEDVVKQA